MNDWYEPNYKFAVLQGKGQSGAPAPQKKKKSRIIGAVILGAAIVTGIIYSIVNTNLNYSLTTVDESGNVETFSNLDPEEGELPDSFQDFFEQFYTSVTTDDADVDIPEYQGEKNFSLQLEKPAGEELSLQELYDTCSPVVVSISSYPEGEEEGYFWGSGVILSEDGMILTNEHVIDGCASAVVQLNDGTQYDALLVGADAVSDLALLKIEPEEKLPVAVFSDMSEVNEGDTVAAIGSPLGQTFRNTLTNGIISAIDRGISYNGHSMTLLQTNTALNEGNSGGALFNMYGQVIGITNMKMMSSAFSGTIEGIGFAIPSTTVKTVTDSFISLGYVPRTYLGMTVGAIPAEASEKYQLPDGLYVSDVTKNSGADDAGIKIGDVITAMNGEPVADSTEVNALKDTLKPGDSICFEIWRDGESFSVDVVLKEKK